MLLAELLALQSYLCSTQVQIQNGCTLIIQSKDTVFLFTKKKRYTQRNYKVACTKKAEIFHKFVLKHFCLAHVTLTVICVLRPSNKYDSTALHLMRSFWGLPGEHHIPTTKHQFQEPWGNWNFTKSASWKLKLHELENLHIRFRKKVWRIIFISCSESVNEAWCTILIV